MGAIAGKQTKSTVAYWLFSVAVMVFLMVVIGGLTRLTGSGLSMVDWRPVTGWLPPLTTEKWLEVFALYKQSPEYLKVNFGMSLDEFKGIFWLEYFHRLWGRLIGVAFAIPMFYFLVKGQVSRKMAGALVGLLILGGLQGLLGWYMVQSGLVHDPAVSQYRLASHLGMAFILIGCLLWAGLSILKPSQVIASAMSYQKLGSSLLLVWTFITVIAGALVAGIDAGLTYNTFPLMDGELVPSGLYAQGPWYSNHFENVTTVQFQHRFIAILLCVFVIAYWTMNKNSISRNAKKPMTVCLALVLIQASVGILTLIYMVPIGLASLHQTMGLVLFLSIVWLTYEVHNSEKRA